MAGHGGVVRRPQSTELRMRTLGQGEASQARRMFGGGLRRGSPATLADWSPSTTKVTPRKTRAPQSKEAMPPAHNTKAKKENANLTVTRRFSQDEAVTRSSAFRHSKVHPGKSPPPAPPPRPPPPPIAKKTAPHAAVPWHRFGRAGRSPAAWNPRLFRVPGFRLF